MAGSAPAPARRLSPGWQKKRDATQRRILETAARILGDEGLRALTIHRLAGDLGYTVGALYRYYPSKGAIIAELQAGVAADIEAALEALLAEAGGALGAAPRAAALVPLVALARVYERLPEVMPERIALVSQALGATTRSVAPEESGPVMAVLLPLVERVAGFIGAATRARALAPGPAYERALVLWGNLHGSLLLRNVQELDSGRAEVRDLTRAAARTTLLGWGAAAPDVTAAERKVDRGRRRAAKGV